MPVLTWKIWNWQVSCWSNTCAQCALYYARIYRSSFRFQWLKTMVLGLFSRKLGLYIQAGPYWPEGGGGLFRGKMQWTYLTWKVLIWLGWPQKRNCLYWLSGLNPFLLMKLQELRRFQNIAIFLYAPSPSKWHNINLSLTIYLPRVLCLCVCVYVCVCVCHNLCRNALPFF
jgi:hypothetical protein